MKKNCSSGFTHLQWTEWSIDLSVWNRSLVFNEIDQDYIAWVYDERMNKTTSFETGLYLLFIIISLHESKRV